MTIPDDTRLSQDVSTPQVRRSVVARCEGCELVIEVDLLGVTIGDRVDECEDCGSPIYVIALSDDDLYLAGFGAGWDACAEFVASMSTGRQLSELTDSAEWAMRLAGGDS